MNNMQIVVLGVVRPEMAINFGSKEVEPMHDEGLFMDSPRTIWGLLKQSGLMVGLKLSMWVVCIILLKMNGLECVRKRIVNACNLMC